MYRLFILSTRAFLICNSFSQREGLNLTEPYHCREKCLVYTTALRIPKMGSNRDSLLIPSPPHHSRLQEIRRLILPTAVSGICARQLDGIVLSALHLWVVGDAILPRPPTRRPQDSGVQEWAWPYAPYIQYRSKPFHLRAPPTHCKCLARQSDGWWLARWEEYLRLERSSNPLKCMSR